MKTLLKSLCLFSLFLTSFLYAQTITKSTFLVKGDCGMCKDRIESTAKETGAKHGTTAAAIARYTESGCGRCAGRGDLSCA